MVAKHSCCFKSSDFFLLGGRYFLILTLGSLYTVWIIKFPLLMEENLVVNATCLFLLSGSCLCRPAPKPEITYRPLCAFRYQEDGEAFESPPLISADDYLFPSRSSCLNYQSQTLRGSQTGTARVELRPFTEIPASQVMSIS